MDYPHWKLQNCYICEKPLAHDDNDFIALAHYDCAISAFGKKEDWPTQSQSKLRKLYYLYERKSKLRGRVAKNLILINNIEKEIEALIDGKQ